MIIAKINPGITVTNQESPFATATSATHLWFTAVVQRYLTGASTYGVNVVYGDATEETGIPIDFTKKGSTRVEFDASELSTWGTDDVVLLQLIATKVGLSITNTYELPDSI